MAETPEVRRDVPTIRVRLQAYIGFKKQLAEIPTDISELDTEKLALEIQVAKAVSSLRQELKQDLKWLCDESLRITEMYNIYSDRLKPLVALFDEVLQVI